jgi:uncharacterized protein YfeS
LRSSEEDDVTIQGYDKVIEEQLQHIEFYIKQIRGQQAKSQSSEVVYDEARVASAQALSAAATGLAATFKARFPDAWQVDS